jgi:uncharacterized protein YqeY
MTLQESIKNDLKTSMKAKDEARTSALRVLIGEFQRQPKKELADAEVLSIIRKLIKAETEMVARTQGEPSDYLAVLEGYVPKQPREEDIREWMVNNIDFSQFKNKMQAMRPVMAHFAGAADGNMVKKILESL